MLPPTIGNLLNEKDEAPTPANIKKPRDPISPDGVMPGVVPRLPSLSDLITPRPPARYGLAFCPTPHPVGLAHALSHAPSPLIESVTPSRPEEDLLALSVARPPIFPPVTPFPAPAPLEPPTSTPISGLASWSRYPFALGRLRPSDLQQTPADNGAGKKRSRSEMEAAPALPELSTRIPLTSPVTEDGNPGDRILPFAPTPTEGKPVKRQAVLSGTQAIPVASESGAQLAEPEDEIMPVVEPSKTAGSKKKKKKKDKRKRRRGPKNIPCPHCSVLFHQTSAVISHIRTVHYRERRFKCPKDGCGQRFGASGDVTRHVDSVHLERRPYKCEDCGNMLSRKTVLYRHIRNVHHKEPKFLEPTPR